MIYMRRPKPKQTFTCSIEDGQPNGLQLTSSRGCMIVFFNEARWEAIRQAVDSEGIPMQNFLSEALDVYGYTVEQAFCHPQFAKDSYKLPGRG